MAPQPSWGAAFAALIDRDAEVTYGQSTINGRTRPPERSVLMFELSDKELTRDILAEFDRLDFEACFRSIFDECWTTRYSAFGAAVQVESCRPSEGSFAE